MRSTVGLYCELHGAIPISISFSQFLKYACRFQILLCIMVILIIATCLSIQLFDQMRLIGDLIRCYKKSRYLAGAKCYSVTKICCILLCAKQGTRAKLH